jgi:peptide/nickel transport system permease protein
MSTAAPPVGLARRRLLPRIEGRGAERIAGAIVVLVVLLAILAPLLAPHDPNRQDLTQTLSGFSSAHPLGTDALGRDVLSRMLYGARISLAGPLIVVALVTLVGLPLGLVAGYFRGPADAVLARVWDVMFAFPALLLAIVVIAMFGPGFWTATLAVSVTYVPLLARVVRSLVLVEREQPYIAACRVQGFGPLRIIGRHVLPNTARVISAQLTLYFAYALLDLAALAFLGLGVRPPTADWGGILNSGREDLVIGASTEVISATVAIVVTVVAVNILGDALAVRAGARR